MFAGKFSRAGSGGAGSKTAYGSTKRDPVHEHLAVDDAEMVTGNAHHSLDQHGGLRVMENDDVAARDWTIRQKPFCQPIGGREHLLVEEKKISNQERALHAFRGNEKGLQQKRKHEQRDHHGLQQRDKRVWQ